MSAKKITVAAPIQIVHGFVPLYQVDRTPNWAVDKSGEYHGDHVTLQTPHGERHLVYVNGSYRGVPPGDWIIEYEYDDNGPYDQVLWVAGKVS